MSVWKFVLDAVDSQSIDMPIGAEILCAREQRDAICVWAKVDPENQTEPRRIEIRGTGHPLGDAGRYLGSAQLRGGLLVFHVFEGAA